MPAEWYKEQIGNRNFLSPVGFKLDLEIFRGVDFFCQTASIPDISMPFVEVPTPYRGVAIAPSGGVSYGDLNVRFIIDEELINYRTVHDWITEFGLANGRSSGPDEYSSARLHILTSYNNVNHIIDFKNIFPVSLSGVQFDATVGDIEYLLADVTFKYESYNIIPISRNSTPTTIPLSVSLTSDVTTTLEPTEPFTLTYTSSGAKTLVINNGVGVVDLTAGSVSLNASTALAYATASNQTDLDVTYTISATSESGTVVTSSVTFQLKHPINSANRLCIAVIDESDSQSVSGMSTKWTQFRQNYPDRIFYLLHPQGEGHIETQNLLRVPVEFLEETDPTNMNIQ
jgi:hypothetical protein